MTDVKVRPPLRPLHFVAPILLVGAHIYYLHSQYERVTGLFIRTGGSTADMTSWTAAFATSLGYCFVVGVLVKMLGKKVTSKNADGKEQTTLVGPVLYDPREAMVVYNVYMTLLSLWMGVVMYGELWRTDTFAWNRHRDISPEGGALLAFAIWVNFISKPTEYVDTLFFLLRGNMRQVSFLHVSHHAIMPIMMASAVLRYPGGNSAFGPGLNSWVHTAMYLYYLVSGLGISLPQPVKKSITVIQLVQFGLISLQDLYLLWEGHGRGNWYWDPLLAYLAFILMVQMFSLFGNFFRKAYGGSGVAKDKGSAIAAAQLGAAGSTKAKAQ